MSDPRGPNDHRRRAGDRLQRQEELKQRELPQPVELPRHIMRQLELTDEEAIALRDALHLALDGWKRRAGDEQRWAGLLERIGFPFKRYP